MTVPAIAAIGAVTPLTVDALAPAATAEPRVSFAQLFSDGVDSVSREADEADILVKSFILDDSVPPHRVIYALEQAQMSLQLMLQVRNHLVEGYQEIMRMQL